MCESKCNNKSKTIECFRKKLSIFISISIDNDNVVFLFLNSLKNVSANEKCKRYILYE